MLDTVEINHVQHISFTQSRLTDAVSVILSEILSYEHPSKKRGCFFVGTEKRRQLPAAEMENHVISNITKDPRRSMALVYWALCRVSWHSGMH